jgi:hypothetical protein
MTRTLIICDRCKNERTKLMGEAPIIVAMARSDSGTQKFDLCHKCEAELISWLQEEK